MGKKWKKKMGRRQEGEGGSGGWSGGGSRFRGGRGGGGGFVRGPAHGDRGGRRRFGRHGRDRGKGNGPSTTHPRSLYKSGADIRQLAQKYPELNSYLVMTEGGRTKIDFKDTESLCVLTKVLAKRDFGLDLELPADKMVPNLQMRYNYLLWVEDLLDKWPPETRGEAVNGIDIGSHASVLYALVAAKKNQWRMLTSDCDGTMLNASRRSIQINSLESLVTVKKVDDRTFLEGILDPNVSFYDFCMFSPPFFTVKEARSLVKPEKGMAVSLKTLTGRDAEVANPGGEKNLMKNIIRESVKLKNRIKLFTIMVGRMSSVDELGPEVVQLAGDDYVGTFVFCYGPHHTYGLAWTFDPNVKLKNEGRLKFHIRPAKACLRLQHTINNTSSKDVFSSFIDLLEEAMVNYKILEKTDDKYSIDISSYYKFWSEKGKEKAEQFKKELPMDDTDGPAGKRIKLDNSEAGSESLSKVFHKGDTMVVSAIVNIIQQKEKGNSVLFEIKITGGVASSYCGNEVLSYFAKKLS